MSIDSTQPSPLNISPLSITQFAVKKKWMCDYGADVIDETHRLSNIVAPLCIEEKSYELYRQSGGTWDSISDEEIIKLLSDETQQWDRIILPVYNPKFFKFIHLHPCEELRFGFDSEELSYEDSLHIAKCKDLRLIDVGFNDVEAEDVQALKQLPNLSKIIYHGSGDLLKCFKVLQEFPHLDLLQIYGSDDCDLESPAFPFKDEDLHTALSYLSSKKHTTRHLHITITIGPVVLAALGQFTEIQSLYIEDVSALLYTGFDLYLLFMSTNLQKSVRHLHLHNITFDEDALSHLAKFHNLVSIDCNGLNVSTEDLKAIIRANADRLQSLTIVKCRHVGDGLLDAISICEKLGWANISGTAVSARAIDIYRKAKRPNWGNLQYKELKPHPRGKQSDENQMQE